LKSRISTACMFLTSTSPSTTATPNGLPTSVTLPPPPTFTSPRIVIPRAFGGGAPQAQSSGR
jgi:hypothetical protein